MTKKTLIVCASVHHHNTEKVARVLAEVLEAKFCPPEAASSECLHDYDLIGFGSGIYYGRFHESLRTWIARMPTIPQAARRAFVFSTSGLPWLWRCWHWPLTQSLTHKGFHVIEQFHCSGFDTFGPLRLLGGIHRQHPDERDLERARDFARKLLKTHCVRDSAENSLINEHHHANLVG